MIRGRRLQTVLAACCAALAGVIYYELEQPPLDAVASAAPVANAAPSGHPRTVTAKSPSFALSPLTDFAEVTERPLFHESRRPLPPTERNASVAAPSLVLVGIVAVGSRRHALIEHGRPARLDRVVEGQKLDGWTVEEIRQDRLIVRNGQASSEVRIKDKPPPRTAPPPALQHPAPAVPAPAPAGGAPAAAAVPPPPSASAVQNVRM